MHNLKKQIFKIYKTQPHVLQVMYSLVPLAIFILFTLYAFCRLGVFSICNPFRCCPTPADQAETATLTPKQLFR